MTTKEQFIEAVEKDEYCEIELPTGDTLVTDWEGDGYFHPYVVPKNEDTERGGEIGDAISEMFDVKCRYVEADNGGGKRPLTYYPDMERPDN